MVMIPISGIIYIMSRSKENKLDIIMWHLKFTTCRRNHSLSKCGFNMKKEKFIYGTSNVNLNNNFSRSTKERI